MAGTRRVGLTRERILRVALALVDEGGLGALSMRRLGAELGVDPMAVYRHLPHKRAIVLSLAEAVFAALPVPDPARPWEQRLRAWAGAYRALARAHPRLVLEVVGDPEAVGVAAVHANEPLYAALEDAALPPPEIVRCAGVVVDFLNGAVLAEAAAAIGAGGGAATPTGPVHPVAAPTGGGPGPAEDPVRAELARRPPGQFPVQRRVLARSADDGGDSFATGLDLIIAGIVARVPAR
jgi:TetR/AcrR family transcriptional regulator, tetracycline repressor protein